MTTGGGGTIADAIGAGQTLGLSVAFACLSVLANKFLYGHYAFTRPYELYFVHGLENAGSFSRDALFDTLQYNPYLLPHRLFIALKTLTQTTTAGLLPVIYFAVQLLVMFAYLHLSKSMFRPRAVSLLVLVLVAFKFSPFVFGSANGLNMVILTPNLAAIAFQLLALSFFLRSRLVPATLFGVAALYCHALTSLFLGASIGGYLVMHRRDFPRREIVLAVSVAVVASLPLFASLLLVTIRNAAPLEPWQLASAVKMAYGHVSLRIWSLQDPARLTIYALVVAGFLGALALDRSIYRTEAVRARVRFLSAAAAVFVIVGGLASEYSATITALQPLKVAWFLELFMGLAAVQVVVALAAGDRNAHVVTVVVAFVLFAMYGSHEARTLLFAVQGAPVAAGRDSLTLEVVDDRWRDVMRAVNRLPVDAYILYPFSKHSEYFTLSERPGLFSLAHVSFLPLGGRLPSVDRDLLDLLRIDRNDDPVKGFTTAWAGLSESQIFDISRKFGVTHVIDEARVRAFNFPVTYSNDTYVIYDVTAAARNP